MKAVINKGIKNQHSVLALCNNTLEITVGRFAFTGNYKGQKKFLLTPNFKLI